MNYIIGCGGVGSWLTPLMCKLVGSEHIRLVDGDRLEEKNLDRQLFQPQWIGRQKAAALAEVYEVDSCITDWFRPGLIEELSQRDWLLVCVDNDPARLDAITECDNIGCQAIICANETNSSEAYYYTKEWSGTYRDPRVYYPNLLSNHENDPRAATIGCTGAAQESNPQLVTANFMAASLLAHLYVLWALKAPKFDLQTRASLPYQFRMNLTKAETICPPRPS